MHQLEVKELVHARDEAFAASVAELPEDDEQRFDALAAMSDAELDAIIAKAFATTIMPANKHEGVTAKLLDFIGFDMADHFTATPENYTGRASKKLVIQALAEAGKAPDAADLATTKKDALADLAAKRLAGTGWVPAIIRTPARPKPEAPESEGAASAKNEIKSAAKKKATKSDATKTATKPEASAKKTAKKVA